MNKGCIGRVRVLLLIVAIILCSVECTELISVNARTRTENKSTTKRRVKKKVNKVKKNVNAKSGSSDNPGSDIPVYASKLNEINLKHYKHAVQAYVVLGKYLYITQTYKKTDVKKGVLNKIGQGFKNHNVVVFSRYVLTDGTYEYESSMFLIDAGHGQTLEYIGDGYFLIECGYYYDKATGNEWSNQIGRIKYQNDTILYNKDIKRFTYMSFMGVHLKGDVVKRVSAAVSSDGTKLIVLRRTVSNRQDYMIYSLSKVKALWNKTLGNEVSCKSGIFKDMQNTDSGFKLCKDIVKIPSSIQGIDLSDGGNGVFSLYISSGDEEVGKKLKIYRFNSNGKLKRWKYVDYTRIWNREADRKVEIEGMRINGDYLQFILKDLKTKKHVVASVLKKDLK